MSKSKRNGVDPQALIEEYGADTARFFMMFATPPEQTLEWSDSGVEGAYRFLKRLWAFGWTFKDKSRAARRTFTRSGDTAKLPDASAPRGAKSTCNAQAGQLRPRQAAVQHRRLGGDEDAQCAGEVAAEERSRPRVEEGFSILLRLLSPITPHICHALWRELGYGDDILDAPWPEPAGKRWCRTRSNWCCR